MLRNAGRPFRAGTIASVFALATAQIVAVQATWTTLSPKGEGFSIEVPGTPSPNSKPGYYIYNADEWAYFVRLSPISGTVREFVSAGDRGPADRTNSSNSPSTRSGYSAGVMRRPTSADRTIQPS